MSCEDPHQYYVKGPWNVVIKQWSLVSADGDILTE